MKLNFEVGRFSTVLVFRDSQRISLRMRITTEMLAVGTTYSANLVFGHRFTPTIIPVCAELRCKFEKDNPSSVLVHQQWKEGGWMKTEMWHFVCTRKDSEFDILLEGMSDNNGSGILIYAIEFWPMETTEDEGTEKLKNKFDDLLVSGRDTDWEEKLPSDYKELIHVEHDTPKKEIYLLLCRGIFIDEGKKWLSILDGKKCLFLSAMEVIDASDHEQWDWKSLPESRFSQAAELQKWEKFTASFRTKAQLISPNTKYECLLVYKLAQNYHGPEESLKVGLVKQIARCSYGLKETYSSMHFVPRSPLIKPKNSLTSQTKLTNYRPKLKWLPIQRKDGWMEINISPRYDNDKEEEDISRDINMSGFTIDKDMAFYFEVSKCGVNMSGIIIEGIELRPCYQ